MLLPLHQPSTMSSAEVIHQKYIHLADVAPRPAYLTKWEKMRHNKVHWLVEMVAEAVSDDALDTLTMPI